MKEECPNCKKMVEFEVGFGLAGGGYGAYNFCPECYFIVDKSQEPSDDPERDV